MRILVFGLPGSGKTTFADALRDEVVSITIGDVIRINADHVRRVFDDWDFTPEGRTRQAQRMHDLSIWEEQAVDCVITDFVAPTPELRAMYKADFAIWMNTIDAGRFADTNKAWQAPVPEEYQAVVTEFNASEEAKRIAHILLSLSTTNG